MFLDYNSQKSDPAQLGVKASGSFIQEHLRSQGWELLLKRKFLILADGYFLCDAPEEEKGKYMKTQGLLQLILIMLN